MIIGIFYSNFNQELRSPRNPILFIKAGGNEKNCLNLGHVLLA